MAGQPPDGAVGQGSACNCGAADYASGKRCGQAVAPRPGLAQALSGEPGRPGDRLRSAKSMTRPAQAGWVVKLSPQPQASAAFGLWNANWALMPCFTKS